MLLHAARVLVHWSVNAGIPVFGVRVIAGDYEGLQNAGRVWLLALLTADTGFVKGTCVLSPVPVHIISVGSVSCAAGRCAWACLHSLQL